MRSRVTCLLVAAVGALAMAASAREDQAGLAEGPADRLADRIATLEREAATLATQARTLVGEVRKLEVDRDLRATEATVAAQAAQQARDALTAANQRIRDLETQRTDGLPALEVQLVDLYKRGRRGEWGLLLSANGVRDLARATRAAEALAYRRQRTITGHQQTLAGLRAERDGLASTSRELREHEARADEARQASARAVAARTALLDDIDARRDLTAQYLSELQEARDRAGRSLSDRVAGRVVESTSVPIAPFRGALAWPVSGALSARFGQPGPTPGSVRNGVDIAAPLGSPVRAIHDGSVDYAEGYTGLGTLVILDHGANNYSLYGYLSEALVRRGDHVKAGAVVGRVGPPSTGNQPAVYFELRIDGRLVDPVQWLQPR